MAPLALVAVMIVALACDFVGAHRRPGYDQRRSQHGPKFYRVDDDGGGLPRRPYRPFLGAVELNIYDGEYVFVIVGNPARFVKMRLNFELDRSLMYINLAQASQTYTLVESERTIGSDIFYLGPYKLRLPVVSDRQYAKMTDLGDIVSSDSPFGGGTATPGVAELQRLAAKLQSTEASQRDYVREALRNLNGATTSQQPEFASDLNALFLLETLRDQVHVDGELALGPGAYLWRYWRNFTLGVDSITLGGYNPYLQRDHSYRGPIVPILYYAPLWTPQTAFMPASETPLPSNDSESRQDTELVDRILRYEQSEASGGPGSAKQELTKLGIINDILLRRQSSLQPRDHVPRGAFVVLGKIRSDAGERVYKIILNYQSYSTYVPRELQSQHGFEIEFENIKTLAAASTTRRGNDKSLREVLADIDAKPHTQRRRELEQLYLINLLFESGANTTRDEFVDFHDDDRGMSSYYAAVADDDDTLVAGDDTLDTGDDNTSATTTTSRSLAEYLRNCAPATTSARFAKQARAVPRSSSCVDGYRRLGMFLDPHLTQRERWRLSTDARYCANSTRIYFSLADHQIALRDNLLYNVVFESPFDDVIMLGKHTLRHLSIFVDLAELKMIISPSYHSFIESSMNFYVCLVMTCLLTCSWLVSANSARFRAAVKAYAATPNVTSSRHHGHATTVYVLVVGQLFSALFCLVGTIVMVWGYRVDRFMYHFNRTAAAPVFVGAFCCVIGAFCGVVVLLDTLTWSRLIYHGAHDPKHLESIVCRWMETHTLRRYLHDYSASLLIWMCLLQHHQTLIDVLYLLGVALILTLNATLSAFTCIYEHRRYELFMRLATGAAYVFLYTFNLLPTIELVWGRHHPHRIFLALIFLMACSFAPAVYLYSMYQRKQLTNTRYTEDILVPFKIE